MTANIGECLSEGMVARLLDAGLEKVDRLEEDGRTDARTKAGDEVES